MVTVLEIFRFIYLSERIFMKLSYLSLNDLTKKHILPPAKDTIDICIFSIKDFSSLMGSIDILSPKEQKRLSSLRLEKAKTLFAASRILLRKILSLYLNYPAEKLLFKAGEHGKPYLFSDNNNFPTIHFNLSHSGDFIALAFSLASPVGIDIELSRTNIRAETLIRRFFHPDEYMEFLELDEASQKDFLFRRWTVREAFLKGIGCGFSMSPDSFYVQELPSEFSIKKSQEDYSSWHISPIPVPDGYYCNIAYQDVCQPPV